jgi:hypothetical protein
VSEEDVPKSLASEPLKGEWASVPAFPLPLHVPREGEPPFTLPLFMRSSFSDTDAVKQEPSFIGWALHQPDVRLFAAEHFLYEAWYASKGTMTDKDFEPIIQDQLAEAHKLQDQGKGELIERFWPHLLQSAETPPGE